MEERLAFFDSNVLIAASLPGHTHHEESNARLAILQREGGACAAHSLAETYNTLTRRSKGYGIHPADTYRMLERVGKLYRIVALTPTETLKTLSRAAETGLAGSLIYDALLIACARKINSARIYTHNVKHFRLIAPDLASSIFLP